MNATSEILWDEKCKYYPKFRQNMKFENEILDRAEKFGLNFNGANVLDVGAGTGIYSLNLAIRGAKITALDISQNMLNELENSAKFHQILGVKTLKADFSEFNAHENGNEFDILTSFFSPAISQENVYGKLIKTPKIGLCLLSWAGKRESEILNASFSVVGEKFVVHNGLEKFKEFLNNKKFKFKSEIFNEISERKRSFEATLRDQIWHLKMHGFIKNSGNLADLTNKISTALRPFCDENGDITEITKTRTELLLCKKGEF